MQRLRSGKTDAGAREVLVPTCVLVECEVRGGPSRSCSVRDSAVLA